MLAVSNLSKGYKTDRSNLILSNVNLELVNDRIYFLMGKNGSGKTTFIKCLLGLENYKGIITYGNSKLHEIRKNIFAIFDDIPLYNDLNGFQNIRLMLPDTAMYDKDFILDQKLLTKEKLKERVKGYSLGERKKLAFLAAIISKPTYLIIDEISNGLDVETLEFLKEYLSELKKHTLVIGKCFKRWRHVQNCIFMLN